MSETQTARDDAGLLTIAEAAQRARVSRRTLFTWLAEGRLTRHGTGRLTRLRWEDVLAALRTPPPAQAARESRAKALAHKGGH